MTRDQRASGSVRIPPELEAALRDRRDGPVLRAVYEAVGRETADDDAIVTGESMVRRRDEAWARLLPRIGDPARVPFTDDVPPCLELVTEAPVHAAGPALVAESKRAAYRRASGVRVRALAAATALLIGGGLIWGGGEDRYHRPPGARTVELPLADGSRVWLAAGSTLSHSRRWALFHRAGLDWLTPDARRVTLDGEAFFVVARDGRPFEVHTDDADVRVLGTRFMVRAAHATHGTRVQVEEGRVAVSHAAQRVELGAGDAAQVMSGALTRGRVPAARVGAAAQGGMAALDEPLGEVFDALSRRYGVVIERSARVNLASSVSFYFPDEPGVDAVLGDLCAAQGLTYTRTSRGYRIDAP